MKTYTYKTFGVMSTVTGTLENPYTYTGREYDSETGLYYYRARYYSAMLGRFLSKDPIGEDGGLNQFIYVGNDPVNAVDPWGLFIWKWFKKGYKTYEVLSECDKRIQKWNEAVNECIEEFHICSAKYKDKPEANALKDMMIKYPGGYPSDVIENCANSKLGTKNERIQLSLDCTEDIFKLVLPKVPKPKAPKPKIPKNPTPVN